MQNRSHTVNSATHAQFSNLDQWIDAHKAELCRILEPERHILFGEWMRAQHSVFYDKLPDLFLAFDIYDRCALARLWRFFVELFACSLAPPPKAVAVHGKRGKCLLAHLSQ